MLKCSWQLSSRGMLDNHLTSLFCYTSTFLRLISADPPQLATPYLRWNSKVEKYTTLVMTRSVMWCILWMYRSLTLLIVSDWRRESQPPAGCHANVRPDKLLHPQVSDGLCRFHYQRHVWSLGWWVLNTFLVVCMKF